jgi:hypothetical protein
VNYDPDAITDAHAFSACIREGFEEVIALASRSATGPIG